MFVRRPVLASVLILAASALAACQQADRARSSDRVSEASAAGSGAHVVEVIARDFAFEAPSVVLSGWTTFRMRNAGEQEHFMVLWRMPDGRTLKDYAKEVAPAFDSIMVPYEAGTMGRGEALQMLGGLLPEWYGSVASAGGPGLASPGRVAETTVMLVPGSYVMECYVKTPEGKFHSALGMLHPLTVTDDSSDASPPEADIDMALTNYEIATDGELTRGEHTVRVRFVDNPEGLLTHDVHLVRLEDGTNPDDVVAWMDWMDALRAPAPAEFLGGAEHMPAGNTAYLTVELEPGSYAWLSEAYADRGMVKEFTVE